MLKTHHFHSKIGKFFGKWAQSSFHTSPHIQPLNVSLPPDPDYVTVYNICLWHHLICATFWATLWITGNHLLGVWDLGHT